MDLLLSSQSSSISQSMPSSIRLYFDGAGKVEECVGMSVNSWDSGGWYEEDCNQKKGFICMHKRWNTKEVKERCKDRPPANDRNMCKRAAAIQGRYVFTSWPKLILDLPSWYMSLLYLRCQILTKRQRMKCLRSCKLCHKSQEQVDSIKLLSRNWIYYFYSYILNSKIIESEKARYMNRPADANTASCPKLSSLSVSGDEFNMKRKPQGKNCISTKVFKRRREIIRVSYLKAVFCPLMENLQ